MKATIDFEFNGGQSRYSGKACDYILVDIKAASGRWYQLYAETTDVYCYYNEEEGFFGGEWIGYNSLCRELLRLAAKIGIPEEVFNIEWREEEPEKPMRIESSICCDGITLYDSYKAKEDLSMYQVVCEDFQKEKPYDDI